MNGNNDNQRNRIGARDAAAGHARSAFTRRDDGPIGSNEMTSDTYLKSLLNEDRPPIPQTSSALTRDAARLRSIMRQTETSQVEAAHESRVMADAADREMPMEIVAMEMPATTHAAPPELAATSVAATSVAATAIAMPVAPTSIADMSPLESITRHHVEDLTTPVDIPLPEESTPASLPTQHVAERVSMPMPAELDITRAPLHEDRGPWMDNSSLDDAPVSIAHDRMPPLGPTEPVSMEHEEIREEPTEREEYIPSARQEPSMPDAVPSVAESLPVDEGGSIIAAISDELRLVRRMPAQPLPERPAEPVITEEAKRMATRLNTPSARPTEVRLSQSMKIPTTARAAEPAQERREPTPARAAMPSAPPAPRSVLPAAAQIPQAPQAPRQQPASTPRPEAPRAAEPRVNEPRVSEPKVEMPRPETQRASRPAQPAQERPAQRVAEYTTGYREESRRTFEPAPDATAPAEQPRPSLPVDPYEAEFQQKKKMVFVITSITIGVILGLGLYAGGGDAISNLFANKREGINQGAHAAASAATAASPTEGSPSAPIAESSGAADDEESVHTAPAHRTPAPVAAAAAGKRDEEKPASPAHAASDVKRASSEKKVVAEKKPIVEKTTPAAKKDASVKDVAGHAKEKSVEKKGEVKGSAKAPATKLAQKSGDTKSETKERKSLQATKDAAKTKSATAKDAKGAAARTAEKESAATKYTVQVRATSDGAEAKRIATKLRAKGMKGVTVVTSGDGDKKLYRIRFGSYGNQTEAKSAAGRAGVDGAWVIKQR